MKPVYVNINNVSRWLYEENSQYEWGLEDFPCLALPWPFAIFKYQMPRYFNDEGVIKHVPPQLIGIPYEIASNQVEIPEEYRTPDVIRDDWAGRLFQEGTKIKLTPKEYRADGLQVQLAEAEGRPPKFIVTHSVRFASQPIMACTGYLDANGRNIGTFGMIPINTYVLKTREHQTDLGLFFPVFMAISLLHCKNVELIDEPVSRQVRRQKERKGGVFYKVLVIEPFKKQTRREAAEHGETEIKRALHICRGHFATYSEERPLFGKVSGTFWKPMHVKGNKQYGEVVKDYKVKR